MISRILIYLLLWVGGLMLSTDLKANSIDSLTKVVQLPAHDTIKGVRYLELAKAWFWENPDKTDSLLRIAESYFSPQEYYRGLSDVHNFRANYHYMGGRPLAACSSLDTAMQYAALDGDTLHLIGIRKNLTILRSEAGDNEGALAAIQESMDYLTAKGDSSLLAEHYVQRGLIRQGLGYQRLALKDFQIARDLHTALGEVARIADAEYSIGKTLYNESNYEAALPYYQSSAKNYLAANQQQYYAEVITLLGINYHRLHRPKQADSCFQLAIQLSERLQQPYNVAHAKILRAESWLERSVYLREARNQAIETVSIFEEILPIMVGSAHLIVARIDTALGNYAMANSKIDEAIVVFRDFSSASNLRNCLRLKADILNQLNQPAAALTAYREAQTLSDSLFNIQQTTSLAELHIEYDTELKEQDIKLKAARIAQLFEEKENVRLRNSLLILSLMAALILMLLGYYSYTQRRKAMQAEVRFKERELAAQRLNLLRKNTLLTQIENRIQAMPDHNANKDRQQLLNTLRTEEVLDQDWETFTNYFKSVHGPFAQELERQYPLLTTTEKRLAYLLRLGTNTSEAATLLHVQPESIRKAKYRLKKKMVNGAGDPDESLEMILKKVG